VALVALLGKREEVGKAQMGNDSREKWKGDIEDPWSSVWYIKEARVARQCRMKKKKKRKIMYHCMRKPIFVEIEEKERQGEGRGYAEGRRKAKGGKLGADADREDRKSPKPSDDDSCNRGQA